MTLEDTGDAEHPASGERFCRRAMYEDTPFSLIIAWHLTG